MDIATYNPIQAAEDGAKLFLHYPNGEEVRTGEGEQIYIVLMGQDSSAWKNKAMEIAKRKVGRRAPNFDSDVQEGTEILAVCTKAWFGFLENGEPLECNYQNAKKLYEKQPWIRTQVDAFIHDRVNFLPNA